MIRRTPAARCELQSSTVPLCCQGQGVRRRTQAAGVGLQLSAAAPCCQRHAPYITGKVAAVARQGPWDGLHARADSVGCCMRGGARRVSEVLAVRQPRAARCRRRPSALPRRVPRVRQQMHGRASRSTSSEGRRGPRLAGEGCTRGVSLVHLSLVKRRGSGGQRP